MGQGYHVRQVSSQAGNIHMYQPPAFFQDDEEDEDDYVNMM